MNQGPGRSFRIGSALLAVVLMIGACDRAPQSSKPPETKDRLPYNQMSRLVATPMRIARDIGLPESEAIFAAQLAEMEQTATDQNDRIRIADMLMAYGVELFQESSHDWSAVGTGYIRRSIPAYEAAFGKVHPEVAVALHSYADTLVVNASQDPPQEAIDSMKRAYDIRLATLGADDPETLAARYRWSAMRVQPVAMAQDPAAFQNLLAQISTDLKAVISRPGTRSMEFFLDGYRALFERYLDKGLLTEADQIHGLIFKMLMPLARRDAAICRGLPDRALPWRELAEAYQMSAPKLADFDKELAALRDLNCDAMERDT